MNQQISKSNPKKNQGIAFPLHLGRVGWGFLKRHKYFGSHISENLFSIPRETPLEKFQMNLFDPQLNQKQKIQFGIIYSSPNYGFSYLQLTIVQKCYMESSRKHFISLNQVLLWVVCCHLLSSHTIFSKWIILLYNLEQGPDVGYLLQRGKKLRKVAIHNPELLFASAAARNAHGLLESLMAIGICVCFLKCHLWFEPKKQMEKSTMANIF